MIVTDKFAFIHLERTGGNFIAAFLEEFFPKGREIGYHYPRKLLPKKYRGLPLIGFVRNPWDWYVSFYSAKKITPEIEEMGFKGITSGLLWLNEKTAFSRTFKREFIRICPTSIKGNTSMGVTRNELKRFTATDVGLYTWLFLRMYADKNGDFSDVQLGRFEDIKSEIGRVFKACDVKFTPSMKNYLRKATDRITASQHSHYRTYFTNALRDGVGEQDRLLVDHFGYKF